MSTARCRPARPGLSTLIVGWALVQAGCCHHYYSGPAPGCPPVAVARPSAVRYGEVCEAPAGTIVGQGAVGSTPIAAAPRPRVVISEPNGSRLAGRSGWRRADPENMATTRVDGALDDDTVRR